MQGFGTLAAGEQAITLHVQDTSGKDGRDSVIVTVGGANTAPTCAITAPADGSSGAVGEAVVFRGEVADPDQDLRAFEVTWASDRDGLLGTSAPSSAGDVSFTWADLSVATHLITLEARDEAGATCTDTIVYSVGSPPTLTVTAPVSGDLRNEGEEVAFAATVSDPEDDATALDLTWESDRDGVFSTRGADAAGAVTFTESGLSRGDHQITVTATDSDGFYAQERLDLTINGLPSAPTVTLAPDPALTSDDLAASATGSVDPEGDPVAYAWTWYRNGTLSTASTSATLPASATARGDLWTARATPGDGHGDGAYGEASLTISNSAPVLSGPSLSPSSGVTTSTALTASASASDADGDAVALAYLWEDATTGSTLGSSASLTLSPATVAPGDTVRVTVTADDGAGGTDSAAASITVLNTPPALGAVAIAPATGVTTGTTLTCSASATDPDGGTPTVTWAWSDGSTGATLAISPATATPGDTVTCTATATDTHGGSDTGSASVTIGNRAPSVDSVAIAP